MSRRKKNNSLKWFLTAVIIIILIVAVQKIYNRYLYNHSDAKLSVVERTWLNYKDEVKKSSLKLDLPADYLLALIALECSGFKEVPSRFEPHVFTKLQDVRDGEVNNFEGIVTPDIHNSNDDALKNLASSWGPFQLMGYQCLYLDIKLKEMRGKNSVYYSSVWIKNAYGKYLEKKQYKDAFHLHNTGKPYPKVGPPKTHNRYYVPKGLKFMKEFRTLLAKDSLQ